MAIVGFQGWGVFSSTTNTNIGNTVGYAPRFAEFNLKLDQQVQEVNAFIQGSAAAVPNTVDLIPGAKSANLQLTVPSVDWLLFQQFVGEQSSLSTVGIPFPGNGVAVSNGTNSQISGVANLTTGVTTATVTATITKRGLWGEARVLSVLSSSSALSTADQISINTATNTFFTSLSNVGAPITYSVTRQTAVDSIGVVANPFLLNNIQFNGKIILASDRASQIGNNGLFVKVPLATLQNGYELKIGAIGPVVLDYKVVLVDGAQSLVEYYYVR